MYPSLTVLEPAALAESVAAASARLDEAAADIRAVDHASLPTLLALLALGCARPVRDLLRPTARPSSRPDRVGDHVSAAGRPLAPGDAPALAALLGRYVAWTGDTAVARALWHVQPLVHTALADVHTAPYGQELVARRITLVAACTALERMAPDVGDAQAAGAFRRAARELSRGLPDILSPDHRILAAALGVEFPTVVDAGQAPAPSGDDVVMTTLHFATSVLGLEPDAPRHRLRLRPMLRELRVRGIPFADGTVSLDVERGGPGEWHLRLEQESGAIPVTAVMEPFLPAAPQSALPLSARPPDSRRQESGAGGTLPAVTVSVDDTPAALNPRPVPGGVLLPVQLVLDAPRRLTIQMYEGRSPE
ncbi:MAG TPA: hypothetical protein VK929_01010 [Longimicrobiales bacterium]|nr:hypothetical protein [Longimicrobiales bacterium]